MRTLLASLALAAAAGPAAAQLRLSVELEGTPAQTPAGFNLTVPGEGVWVLNLDPFQAKLLADDLQRRPNLRVSVEGKVAATAVGGMVRLTQQTVAVTRVMPMVAGYRVASVLPGSPAEGVLAPGDVLLEVNGKPVISREQLITVLSASQGKPITMAIGGPRGPRVLTAQLRPDTPQLGVPGDMIWLPGDGPGTVPAMDAKSPAAPTTPKN